MRYFRYLPTIDYSNQTMVNIVVRAKVRDAIARNVAVMYPYVIPEGERPDSLSHKYYGSADFAWLIFYANDIVDPIVDWPFNYNEFQKFLIAKYGSVFNATQQVKSYHLTNGLEIDYTTYLNTPEVDRFIKTAYQYEDELNQRKREIILLDNAYTSKVLEELKTIFR